MSSCYKSLQRELELAQAVVDTAPTVFDAGCAMAGRFFQCCGVTSEAETPQTSLARAALECELEVL